MRETGEQKEPLHGTEGPMRPRKDEKARKSASSIDTNELTDMDRTEDKMDAHKQTIGSQHTNEKTEIAY